MKFGQKLQSESVPRWRIHNIDYNSLKHEIKAHTTKNQATAITIPGSEDVALTRFENGFYDELYGQHERVGDFVMSKTDEIGHRLTYLVTCIHRLSNRYPSRDHLDAEASAKLQRRLSKYEHELLKCGDDIHSLDRFINAQVVAFRKILKKYQKWTGSSKLSQRFRENILSDPKSFTRRDLSSLRSQYDVLLADLRESLPENDGPDSPESLSIESHSNSVQYSNETPATPPHQNFAPLPPPVHYWNEYDDGSEAGDRDNDYAIYINPDDQDMQIPGLDFIKSTLAQPLAAARNFFTLRTFRASTHGERAPLLGAFGVPANHRHSDTEDEYTSCDELPSDGYATHYAAFPSIGEQRAALQRDNTLFWVTLGSFVVSFVLIAITSALIATGRHKMRLEVEAGVTVGIITSLFSACVGLGITMTRTDEMPIWHHISLWLAFLSVCVLNGMLLVLVMEW
ncbi:hypothetical protein TD95_001885 [Thielaviopsis punctulata]|uniref:SPX domain-containing protein n=1 Tax=Thielaviopsis punctulata TaxID=72032 RepID=A0A0F4ZFI8_9PEZI|nr:hypothetical protein TD95_001885 [Thielaviopsis punctulata]